MAKKKQPSAPALPADDQHPTLSRETYDTRLPPLQFLMRSISLRYFREGLGGIVVVEGSDAAGKGGAIRRMTAELDPRHYRVWPIGPPNAAEAQHHYLWRFWQRIPPRGQIGIFDRSWYGRVLVERVEGLTPEERWRRAYDEISAFEESLVADGMRLVKVYLHVTEDEQRRRLAERVGDPHKRWKLTAADFRALGLRERYDDAVAEMLERTSTAVTPWQVIPADSKRHARIAVLEAVTDVLAKGVDLTPLPLDDEIARLAHEALGDLT